MSQAIRNQIAVAPAELLSPDRYPQEVGAGVPKATMRRNVLRTEVSGAPHPRSGVEPTTQAESVAVELCLIPIQ